jgi:hypothetical protein
MSVASENAGCACFEMARFGISGTGLSYATNSYPADVRSKIHRMRGVTFQFLS